MSTKVTAYVTLVAEFESEDPNKADYFSKDFVERLRFTVPYDTMNASFRTVTGGTDETE